MKENRRYVLIIITFRVKIDTRDLIKDIILFTYSDHANVTKLKC